jgi:hypothetical protein
VLRLLHKPGHETWRELRGRRVFPIQTEVKRRYDSMMRGHTFSPPSDDPRLVFSEAVRNMTAALARLRRREHLAREVGLCLRRKDYTAQAAAAPLPCPTSHDGEVAPVLRGLFDALFTPGQTYRSTLVWLGGLADLRHRQLDLFEETLARHACGKLDAAIDLLNRRYGQNAVAPAALLDGRLKPWHPRDAAPARYGTRLVGEGTRHLSIPRMTLGNPV